MISINPNIQSVSAFAPATCANVAVGFDILGFSFGQVGDTVTLTRRNDKNIIIEMIDSKEPIPLDPDKNTASLVIKKLCQEFKLDTGFSLSIRKGIPLSSGMGGSAASAVAALVACNGFLKQPLSLEQLAEYALLGEELASGQKHADNIVPCLWGGLTLIRSLNPIEVIQLPIPDVYCALVHPHLHVPTESARSVLKSSVLLKEYIIQSANLAAFIAALYQGNLKLLQQSLKDVLIEPQRAQFVPGFKEIKQAASQAGALGVSFSGSGPSIFAFASEKDQAEAICVAMKAELRIRDVESDYWVSRISGDAAKVIEITTVE